MTLVRGTVTQASPLLVRLDGASVASTATRLSSYTPVVGHRVLVTPIGSALAVLGQEVS